MELLFENESTRFYYDKETRISKMAFFGLVDMPKIMEAFKFIVDSKDKLNSKAVISDLRDLRGTYTMLIDYLDENLYPFLAAKGVLCNALIINSDAFIKFSTKKLSKTINSVQIKSFEDFESAEKWVNSVIAANE